MQSGTRQLTASRRLSTTETNARAEQQSARQSAAEGSLGQRDIGRRKPQPNQREQQPISDKTDYRGDGVASGNGPSSDAEDQEHEADIESQGGPATPAVRSA